MSSAPKENVMRMSALACLVATSVVFALTNCGVATNQDVTDDSELVNPHAKPDAGAGTQTVDATVDAAADAGAAADVEPPPLGEECHAAQSGELIPARSVTQLGTALPTKRRVYVDDMFSLLRSLCGGCHVDGNQGGVQYVRRQFNADEAAAAVLSMKLENVESNGLPQVMPPPSVHGKAPSQRSPDDPANELMRLLKSYIAAGGPASSYLEDIPGVTADGTDPRNTSPYRFDADVASGMTSIGNCIPDKRIYATELEEMDALDAKLFAALPKSVGTLVEQLGLPLRLEETDLFTFDAKALAKRGVVAWAPNYPLFFDGARSIRHVRVPRGESIKFDKVTQQFIIPEGTRFYKTLTKPVVEADGRERWKKLETQLIVAYSDEPSLTGYRAVTAMYGTYVWSEDETEALLLTDPTRDAKPFRDRIITYLSDEVKAAAVLKKNLQDPADEFLDVGAIHHYAVPGVRRCVECHMGSPSRSFVLGFQPLQIKRRPAHAGGVRATVGADELSQLQRFIEYGLITGVDSPDDIADLENSQGARVPRNDYELDAQALMLPACANCHSPRGAATEYNPELKSQLDFQPSNTGGIFQFPLESYSPRIVRGGTEKIPIPYITPSLFDLPVPTGDAVVVPRRALSSYWTPKCTEVDAQTPDGTALNYVNGRDCILAPWRSLIFRGVDAPFSYSDDLALFPRMPVHTAGYDCDAPGIIAKWMLSIPSVLKNPNGLEYIVSSPYSMFPRPLNVAEPQPYVEVKPGQEGYSLARADAQDRLLAYQGLTHPPYSGYPRGAFCPGNADILDKEVLRNPKKPVPTDASGGALRDGKLAMPRDNVPDNVHWVINDQSQVPGDWYPRRTDWNTVLVEGKFPKFTGLTPSELGLALSAQEHEKLVVSVLKEVTLTSNLKGFADDDLPMGLWQEKPNCNYPGELRVSSFKSRRPAWMDRAKLDPNSNAPVYMQAPGEYVYQQVCGHCHGALGNSGGREATTLSEMTGGYANVTNFITGIGLRKNRARVFESFASAEASTEDWAARYFVWMGLGGTKQKIPQSIIAVVSSAGVFGTTRPKYVPPEDANMLSSAENLCAFTMPTNSSQTIVYDNREFGYARLSLSPLIEANGDHELWYRLCAIDNPRPVRAMVMVGSKVDIAGSSTTAFFPAASYPPNAEIMDHAGQVVVGLSTENLSPWCLREPLVGSTQHAEADAWRQSNLSANGKPIPYCPTKDVNGKDYILAASNGTGGPSLTANDLKRWAIRGAINAGIVSYLYVNRLAKGLQPAPAYNECEALEK